MSASDVNPVMHAQILQAATEIGVLGSVIPLIMAQLCDPEATAQEVAQVIGRDPGLAARVLRVANSAYYGASGSVATLERAFVLLGVDAVRGRVAGPRVAPTAGLGGVHRRAAARFRGHAAVAGRPDPAASGHCCPGRRTGAKNPREVERSFGCIGHEHCAAVVFRVWNLPATLVAAVGNHHAPAAAPPGSRRLAALVHLADTISLETGHGYALEPQAWPLQEGALELLGIQETFLSQVVEALPERVRELQQVLSGS